MVGLGVHPAGDRVRVAVFDNVGNEPAGDVTNGGDPTGASIPVSGLRLALGAWRLSGVGVRRTDGMSMIVTACIVGGPFVGRRP